MPKISIITINYNNLEGLKRTVESVINQTWQEFEYIVIDGGSTDGSVSYIESQSHNIDYWVSEPDQGIYNAMNKGIAKAAGEYLLFLNSGDHLYSDTVIQKNHHLLVEQDLIYFNLLLKGEKFLEIKTYPNELQFSHLFFNALPHQATFIKRELFVKIGFYDEKLKIVSDWKFMIIALFIYRCSYKYINETFSVFYLDGISESEMGINFAERSQVLNEYFGAYVSDYREILELKQKQKSLSEILGTNRFKMLSEIEKSKIGKKIVSFFFRSWIFLFSNKKLKDVLYEK